MARNTVNKELVNQPLREAEGYEYIDKYKNILLGLLPIFFSASKIKKHFDFSVLLFPPPHFLLIPQQK